MPVLPFLRNSLLLLLLLATGGCASCDIFDISSTQISHETEASQASGMTSSEGHRAEDENAAPPPNGPDAGDR